MVANHIRRLSKGDEYLARTNGRAQAAALGKLQQGLDTFAQSLNRALGSFGVPFDEKVVQPPKIGMCPPRDNYLHNFRGRGMGSSLDVPQLFIQESTSS